jgi:hypothetical protein
VVFLLAAYLKPNFNARRRQAKGVVNGVKKALRHKKSLNLLD